jgi:hypothetical protein
MNDFKKIYANGCSFTGAGGINFEYIRKKYLEILGIQLDDNYIQYAYPNILGKELSIDVHNEATSGGSMNRLIRKTYQYVYNNQSTISQTLFMLELPPMWREEVYCNQLDRLMNVTWGTIKEPATDMTDVAAGYDIGDLKKIHKELESYFYNFINTDFEYKKSMNNFLGLMYFLKNKNVNVILIDNTFFKEFLQTNNLKHDFNFVNFDNMPMSSWFAKNNLTINDELGLKIDGHAGISGNIQIANIVLKYLISNKFISDKNLIKII